MALLGTSEVVVRVERAVSTPVVRYSYYIHSHLYLLLLIPGKILELFSPSLSVSILKLWTECLDILQCDNELLT